VKAVLANLGFAGLSPGRPAVKRRRCGVIMVTLFIASEAAGQRLCYHQPPSG